MQTLLDCQIIVLYMSCFIYITVNKIVYTLYIDYQILPEDLYFSC